MKLPTKEEVISMTEAADINYWRDEIDAACKQIETDLEFSDGSDLAWERSAKSALAHYRTIMGHLTRRLKGIEGKKGPTSAEQKQNSIKEKQIRLSQREMNIEEQKIKAENKKREHTERMDYAMTFLSVCRKTLSHDSFSELAELAAIEQRKKVNAS